MSTLTEPLAYQEVRSLQYNHTNKWYGKHLQVNRLLIGVKYVHNELDPKTLNETQGYNLAHL